MIVAFEMSEELHQQYVMKTRIINSTSTERDTLQMFQIVSVFYLEIWSHLFWKKVLLIINLYNQSSPSPIYHYQRSTVYLIQNPNDCICMLQKELHEKLLFHVCVWWLLPFSLTSYSGNLCIEKKDCRLFCPKKSFAESN